jgi:hypothetical protein
MTSLGRLSLREYRNFKRHFSAGTSGAQPLKTPLGHPSSTCWRSRLPCGVHAHAKRRTAAPAQHTGARHRAVQRDFGWGWTGTAERCMVGLSGVTWAEDLGKDGSECRGEGFQTGFQTSRGVMHARNPSSLHAPRLRDHAQLRGLGDPVERFLATAGGRNGGWDGGELEMPQDAGDRRLVGGSGNDPE